MPELESLSSQMKYRNRLGTFKSGKHIGSCMSRDKTILSVVIYIHLQMYKNYVLNRYPKSMFFSSFDKFGTTVMMIRVGKKVNIFYLKKKKIVCP